MHITVVLVHEADLVSGMAGIDWVRWEEARRSFESRIDELVWLTPGGLTAALRGPVRIHRQYAVADLSGGTAEEQLAWAAADVSRDVFALRARSRARMPGARLHLSVHGRPGVPARPRALTPPPRPATPPPPPPARPPPRPVTPEPRPATPPPRPATLPPFRPPPPPPPPQYHLDPEGADEGAGELVWM